jgi:hypothetical protein
VSRRRDTRRTVALALLLAWAALLLAPAVALAAVAPNVTYTLPSDWKSRSTLGKGGPFGTVYLTATLYDSEDMNAFGEVKGAVTVSSQPQRYATMDDFLKAWGPHEPAAPSGQNQTGVGGAAAPTYLWYRDVQKGTTTFSGLPAWYVSYLEYDSVAPEGQGPPTIATRVRLYYIDRKDSAVLVMAESTARDSVVGRLDEVDAQTKAVLDSIKIEFGPAATGTGWQTVAGGLAAVAAAAVAMAAAFAKSSGGKVDPNTPIGFVLQLSTPRLAVRRDQQAPFEAKAWRVRASGAFELATDATVTLAPPPGVGVTAGSGAGVVSAGVWQTDAVRAPAALHVNVSCGGGGTSASVPVTAGDEAQIVVRFDPERKRAVLPNDKDSLTLVARVVPASGSWPPDIDPAAVRASIAFRGPDSWLYLSSPADWDADGRAVRIQCSSPEQVAGGAAPGARPVPPQTLAVEVTATVGTQQLTQQVAIPIAKPPTLDANPDDIALAAGSGDTTQVSLVVKDPGDAQWTYRAEWAEDAEAIATPDIVEDTPSSATMTLTESAPDTLGGDSPKIYSKLRIFAMAEGFEDVERDIMVAVLREGLFAETVSKHPDGTFHVRADGKKQPQTIYFRVYVKDPATGRIAADPKYVSTLVFEPLDEPGTPERGTVEFARLSTKYERTPQAAPDEGPYQFSFEREVPGKTGEVMRVRYLASVPGLDPEKYETELALGLETTSPETDSPEWQAEYKRASDIIDRLMPVSYRASWHKTLEMRAQFLGAEGLAELRKRIWFNAAELVQAEGAEGYLAEANWADRIVKSLELAEFLGDICFNYLVSVYLGPIQGQFAQAAKPMLITGITDYLNDATLEEIESHQLGAVFGIFEGKVVDMDTWGRLTGASKVKLWMAFVTYHLLKERFYNKRPIMECLKIAAEQARDLVVFGWIQQRLHKAMGTSPGSGIRTPGEQPPAGAKPAAGAGAGAKPAAAAAGAGAGAGGAKPARTPKPAAGAAAAKAGQPAASSRKKGTQAPVAATRKRVITGTEPGDPMPKPGKPVRPRPLPPRAPRPVESASSEAVRRATTVGPDGVPYADRRTVLDIMRDPQRVRDLKNASPEVQAAFNNTRNQIYRQHDAQVLRDLRNQPGMRGRKLAVLDVRTPGSDPNTVNTDRDFRVVEIRHNPATGKNEAIEIDNRRWKTSSDRAFASATGGPTDPKGAADHAKAHQQLGADRYHAEASPDLAMQGFVQDPHTGQWRQAQVRPNIQIVKEGGGTLHDPEALGQTYRTKVADALREGNRGDAYVQAGKAVETMTGVRAGYARQGYEVGQLSPQMRQGMAAIGQGKTNYSDPAAIAQADANLRAAGFNGLPDFMNKLSGHIESLKNAKLRE